jgi:hypothetical protein
LRPSTGDNIEGGGSVEAEHWVEGDDGVGVGIEAGKRRRRRCRAWD